MKIEDEKKPFKVEETMLCPITFVKKYRVTWVYPKNAKIGSIRG